MIETIFFDFVGVLLFPRDDNVVDSLVNAVDGVIGSVTDDVKFKESIQRQYHLAENDFNGLLQAIVDRYQPYEPLWKLLPVLKVRYKLGVINNGTFLTYPLFDAKYHLDQYFDVFISSALSGVCKPNIEIFRLACEKIDTFPGNCLFMDDSPENITAAQLFGMRTIYWPDKESGFRHFEMFLSTVQS
jgi:HAD superfamily hydrolase (TIGR01509 family)